MARAGGPLSPRGGIARVGLGRSLALGAAALLLCSPASVQLGLSAAAPSTSYGAPPVAKQGPLVDDGGAARDPDEAAVVGTEAIDPMVVAASVGPAPLKATVHAASNVFFVPRFVRSASASSSRLIVQSADVRPATFTLSVRDENGVEVANRRVTIASFASATIRAEDVVPAAELAGSATLLADADVVVAVEEGTLAYGAVSRPAPLAGFPLVTKAGSLITVQNVTDLPADVVITYTPTTGAPIPGGSVSLPAYASRTLNLPQISALPAGFVGSAIAQANNVAIAGVALTVAADGAAAYAASAIGSERISIGTSVAWRGSAPASIAVQNLSAAAVQATILQRRAVGDPYAADTRQLAPYGVTVVALPSDVDSVAISAPAGAALAAIAQVGALQYAGVRAVSVSYVPSLGGAIALTVHNLGDAATTAQLTFLDASGTAVRRDQWQLPAGAATTKSLAELQLPAGFLGAALAAADQPLRVFGQ